jgi:hypothetical protein
MAMANCLFVALICRCVIYHNGKGSEHWTQQGRVMAGNDL